MHDAASDPRNARRNIWVLTAAQSLGGANAPIVISLGGLVGQKLSSDPALITLPVSLLNLGLALGTLPAAYVMRRFGRRAGYVLGGCIGLMAGMIAALGIMRGSFAIFCAGTSLAGFYSSYVQSYRFAAADGAAGSEAQKAIARVMLGGLIAAVIGPQLVIWRRDTVPGMPFAGSFISQAVLAGLAIPIVLLLRKPSAPKQAHSTGNQDRPLREILTSPRYLVAIATAIR